MVQIKNIMAKCITCHSCGSPFSDKRAHTFAKRSGDRLVRLGVCEHCIACPNEGTDQSVTLWERDGSIVVIKDNDDLVHLLRDWGYEML